MVHDIDSTPKQPQTHDETIELLRQMNANLEKLSEQFDALFAEIKKPGPGITRHRDML